MTIKTVSYHKTFNLGNYESERIGLEIELSEEDNIDDIFQEAKSKVHELFNGGNNSNLPKELPVIQKSESIPVPNEGFDSAQTYTKILSAAEKRIRESEATITEINNCTSIDMLSTFEKLASSKTELKEAYDNKLKSFQTEK